jgi:transcription-repair coupling factor (superfamily II helicase)
MTSDNQLKIIKTLPHTSQLFIGENLSIYAPSYSQEAVHVVSNAQLFHQESIKYQDLIDFFNQSKGYSRVEQVNDKSEFSIKGDSIKIWAIGYESPIRLEFFGDSCESIQVIDNLSGKSLKRISSIVLVETVPDEKNNIIIENYDSDAKSLDRFVFTNKNISGISNFFTEYNITVIDTDLTYPPLFAGNEDLIESEVEKLLDQDFKVYGNSERAKKIKKDLVFSESIKLKFGNTQFNISKPKLQNLPAGFISNNNKCAFFTNRELFSSVDLKRSSVKSNSSRLKSIIRQFEGEIEIGSFIVHEDYGVAIYKGLQEQEADGILNQYMLLEFDRKDELYVPLDQIAKITKYLNNESTVPKLSKLGTGKWNDTKKAIQKKTFEMAKELLDHYAKRELSKTKPININENSEYKNFVSKFEFDLTADQVKSLEEVFSDLSSDVPMDRILVGDVGFGKTEIVLRAAFKVAENGGQVAVLAPTTVLCAQHFNVFKDRFKDTKYKVGMVSRFNTTHENKDVIDKLEKGEINIVIGTHRLLSDDVRFKELQLLVIDEEQKFGVAQKEKIKKKNYEAHLLSLSATPIPRSLNLALSSIQDISIISTPPLGRKGVNTELIYENWNKVFEAIQVEIERGGQVYFIHNRVSSMPGIVRKLKEGLPSVKVSFAHGQMSSNELDRIITDFYKGKSDILIATSIIENGLDIPTVNTLIIHDAHTFGLSQLYQMRGRVGRSETQAYCYLMAPSPSKNVIKANKLVKEDIPKLYMERIQSLIDNQDLGAGFRIASRDLEIRGAGDILGKQQHGHIETIGYALYIEMLAKAVEKLQTNVDS